MNTSKQTQFNWTGTNTAGLKISGELEAVSLAAAQSELRHRGVRIEKIKEASFLEKHFKKRQPKIKAMDIVLFTRQLATMLGASLPIVKAFEIIGVGHENASMEKLVLSMKDDLSAGNTLAQTLARYPQHFDMLYCNLIYAGEHSGTLDVMLERVAHYLEKTQTLKRKIKKASMYPAIVFSVAMITAGVLLIFVVPRFQGMFGSFGADLPAFTQYVVNLSHFLQSYWWMVLGVLFGGIFAFIRAKKTSPRFVYELDKRLLKLPVIGRIAQKVTIARFTRTLSTTFAAGMPIVDAFECVIKVIENKVYHEALARVKTEISTGQQMSVALQTTGLFPNLVIKMVGVGEESGTLEHMLNKVASYYEEEVDGVVDNLGALLEPLIMMILGLIIGSFVVAMYLPIFRLGSVM